MESKVAKVEKMKFAVDSKEFKKAWEHLYDERPNNFCDCAVVCASPSSDGQSKEILAHRSVLAFMSPFFKDAFLQSPDARVELPPLPQLSFENVDILIRLMYTGHINIPPSDIGRYGDLILASTFLRSEALTKGLTRLVFTSKERVVAVFGRLASSELCHEDSAILESFTEFFEKSFPNARMLLEKPDFVATVDLGVLRRVLGSPKLVLTEADVFKIALNWSQAQATKTGKPLAEVFSPLKECIQYERFGFNQVRDVLHPTGLFTQPELMQMYLKAKPEADNSLRNPVYMPFEWLPATGFDVAKEGDNWKVLSTGGSRWKTIYANRQFMPGSSTITARVKNIGGCGWISIGLSHTTGVTDRMLGRDRESWAFCGNGETFHAHPNDLNSGRSSATWARNDVIVMELDFDTGFLTCKRNGSQCGRIRVNTTRPLWPAISLYFGGEGFELPTGHEMS